MSYSQQNKKKVIQKLKPMTRKTLISNPLVYIFFLWLILTAININKAYHIDDTFHLEAAEHIGEHPLRPMSGYINWDHVPTPMYEHNQPPLFFYLIAFYQKIFGNNEIPMHFLLSIFTFLSLWYFYQLILFLKVKQTLTLLTIFGFCPAFIVNQNLMTDVPILCISLATIYYLLKGQQTESIRDYIYSALLLTAGLLIKYSLLPLFFVILLTLLASKSYKKTIVLIIPILGLTLWSIWNKLEFGAMHMISRPRSEFNSEDIITFISTLGAMSVFSVVFIYNSIPKKMTRYGIILSFVIFIALIPMVYFDLLDESIFNKYLNFGFIANGSILIVLILIQFTKNIVKERVQFLKSPFLPLTLYVLGVSSFIVLFAPFNATRHVLLVIPFILLIGHKQFEMTVGSINQLVMFASISLGLLLGISDWVYADFYRKNAENIKVEGKIYSLGHWGWQWYTRKAGMTIYSKEDELNLRNGDLIVFPKDISKQDLNTGIQLDTIRCITEPSTILTFFSGKNFASLYNSYREKPSWTLSKAPIDTIFICKVKNEINIDELIQQIKKDETWLNHIKAKAIERNIPLDSMLILDAIWAIEQKRK